MRHLIRVMRRHDLTEKKTMTKTKTKTKTKTMTKTIKMVFGWKGDGNSSSLAKIKGHFGSP